MMISDLDYLENVEPAIITGDLSISGGINVAFFTLIEQKASAFAGAISDKDANAVAIATNEAEIRFNGVPVFP